MIELPFAKGHALGNDYLVVDAVDLPWPLTAPRIRAFCDRRRGPGADGILVGDLDREPVRLRIYNPDGSEAEKSGNGLRIFAAWLHGRGRAGTEPFPVALATDEVRLQVLGPAEGAALDIRAEMGPVSFRGEDVRFRHRAGEVLGHELELEDGERVAVHTVSLGNPHCVVFVDELRRDQFLRVGPQLATHPAFGAGTNVQLARVAGSDTLEAWIYERGAGETDASGSSACAVAAAALRTGRVQARELRVRMPGGAVAVQIDDAWNARLRGPAGIIYHARLTPETVAAWGNSA